MRTALEVLFSKKGLGRGNDYTDSVHCPVKLIVEVMEEYADQFREKEIQKCHWINKEGKVCTNLELTGVAFCDGLKTDCVNYKAK